MKTNSIYTLERKWKNKWYLTIHWVGGEPLSLIKKEANDFKRVCRCGPNSKNFRLTKFSKTATIVV